MFFFGGVVVAGSGGVESGREWSRDPEESRWIRMHAHLSPPTRNDKAVSNLAELKEPTETNQVKNVRS